MSALFKKGKMGKLKLKNRIVMPPMCMYASCNSGLLKKFHHTHYCARALGGVGLIIVEATAIEPKGRISIHDLGLWQDAQIKKHKIMNKRCHEFGAKMAIQLAHAGRKSGVPTSTPLAPSAIAFSEESPYKMPKAATLKDIQAIKKLFLKAALRAKKANYDAIELHAAHGYLLCEFLSALSNKRKDKYGGSLENRCALIVEIAQSIKEKVKLPLIVRISAHEWMNTGWNLEDSIYLCQELEKVGVDAIHVSAGGNQNIPECMPVLEPLYQCDYAKEIKKNIEIPVIAVGLITTAAQGENLLNEQFCDYVAYGRELLRSPNFVFDAANKADKRELIHKSYMRAYI
ncbi:MAG: tRNA-dihydrouridine synthase [Candidatus Marinarcus sp.]|uniref:oxidoreductase n=1 Tax=Candidatus Marinarcus sp. TaxID=3100987 RepID=UPI003B000A3A